MKGGVIAALCGICGLLGPATGWAQLVHFAGSEQTEPSLPRGLGSTEDQYYRRAVSTSFALSILAPHWPVRGLASEAPSSVRDLARRFKHEGLPLLRLSEGEHYRLAVGLNPRGLPGLWWVWKPPGQ
jgi:hypothetical protein